ncbi:MAG TPA: autotransporter-associated beta strand repeat-containing protein, partial [Gammaproteobacteria bacterium]|nr:autotransporter-associated beta strand repeat-containing protein [Gammaproteobacteria bacterium]
NKSGTGTLVLGGVNTYSGATNVSTGIVSLQNAAGFGSSSLVTVLNNAAVEINGSGFNIANNFDIAGTGVSSNGVIRNLANSNTISGTIVLSSPAAIGVDADTLTLSGVVSGTALSKNGAGTLVLSANNTYTGTTNVNAGIIRLSNAAGFGASPLVTVANGTAVEINGSGFSVTNNFDIAGTGISNNGVIRNLANSNTISGTIALSSPAALGVDAGTLTLSGVVSGTDLSKNGAGTLVLSGNNTYTGSTTLNAGTLAIDTDSRLGTTPSSPTISSLVFNGGTLETTATFTLDANRGITLSTAGNFFVDPATTLTYNGIIAGSGTLNKSGTGTLVLGGANSYTGSTTFTAGILAIDIDSRLGAAPGLPTPSSLVFNGGTLETTATFTLNANRGINLGTTGNFLIDPATTLSYNGVIAGPGALNKSGTGTLVLGGANSYTGSTTFAAGILAIDTDSRLGATPVSAIANSLVFNGGTLETTATFTLNANRGIALTASGNFLVDPATTLTYNGIIAGSGTLNKSGTGTLVLGGVNTYSGATNVNVGELAASHTNALGASSSITVSSGAALHLLVNNLVNNNIIQLNGTGIGNTGALRLSANNTNLSNPIQLQSNSSIAGTGTGSFVFSGNITGTNAGLIIDLPNAGVSLPATTLTTSGDLSATVNGPIVQTGALTIPGTASFTTGASPITLTQNNAFTGVVSLSNSGTNDVALYNSTALTLGLVNVGRDLTVNSLSSIGQNSTVNARTLTTTSVGGTVLTNANTLTNFNASNTGGGNISLINTTPTLTIVGLSQSGSGNVDITNTGALATAANITSQTGDITLTTLSPDSTERTLTINNNITTNGGAITAKAANNTAGTATSLIVLGNLSTGSGTTGVLTLGGGLSLTGTLNAGANNIVLQGNGSDVTINNGTFTQSVEFSVVKDLNISGNINVTGSLSLVGDNLNSGIGGVILQSGANIVVTGDLFVQGSSGVMVSDPSIGIDVQNGATVTAGGSITFAGKTALNNNVITANNGTTFTDQVALQGNATINTNNAPINFNNGVQGLNNLTLDAGSLGNVTFDGTSNINIFTIINMGDFTNNGEINAASLTQLSGNNTFLGFSTLNTGGPVSITGNNVTGHVNVGSLFINVNTANLIGTIGGTGGAAAAAKVQFTHGVPGTLFFNGIDLVLGQVIPVQNLAQNSLVQTNVIASLLSYYNNGASSQNGQSLIIDTSLLDTMFNQSIANTIHSLSDMLNSFSAHKGFLGNPLRSIPINPLEAYLPMMTLKEILSSQEKTWNIGVQAGFIILLALGLIASFMKQLRKEKNVEVIRKHILETQSQYHALIELPFKLRTAITNVIGFASLLHHESHSLPDEMPGYLRNILAEVDSILPIVQHLSKTVAIGNSRVQVLLPNQFLSLTSFKLRTITNNIIGFTALLSTDNKQVLTKVQRDYVTNLTASTRDMATLINEMPDISEAEGDTHMIPSAKALINDLSFQLRTSANNIKGFSELMQTQYADTMTQTQKDYMGYVLHNSDNILKIISDMSILGNERLLSFPVYSEDDFLTTLSFELRGTINNIVGFSQLLIMGEAGALTSEQQVFLEHIIQSSQQVMQIVTVRL